MTPPTLGPRTDHGPRSFALLYLLAWVPAALLAFHLKYTLLNANGGGFEYLAQLEHLPSAADLSLWQRAALLQQDALIVGAVIPLLLWAALRYLKPAARGMLMGAVGCATMAVLFVELKCYWEVGAFLPISVLRAGVTDAGRDYLGDYLPIRSLVKLIVLVVAAIGIAWAVTRLELHSRSRAATAPEGRRFFWRPATLALVAPVALLCIPWAPRNPYTPSAFLAAIKAFVAGSRDDASRQGYDQADPEALSTEYRSLTRAPLPNGPSPYWARARGYDVIFFVLETAPAQCLDLDAAPDLFPNLRALRAKSFVASQHHSTYPYTVRAVFSIYSSWYPGNTSIDAVKLLDHDHSNLRAPGVVRSARAAGYQTGIFVPDPVENWEHDRQRYEALGFSELVFPRNLDRGATIPSETEDPALSWRRYKDRAALALLKEALLARIRAHERYVYAFHPQYSHGPWPRIGNHSGLAATCAAGRALFHVEDDWIGEVVHLLAQQRRLDKTLIVITGDHGIRTRGEHPTFVGGTLDAISYHVPLLIYAPGVLTSTKTIAGVTSHIDIAPSVLDLLGISMGRGLEQGSPIWDPRLQNRVTFFLGRNYLGADGFYDRGRAVMLKYAFGGVSTTDWTGRLGFSASDVVMGEQPFATAAKAKIRQMNSIQAKWVNLMVPSEFADAAVTRRP
jgi:hypothetical protein